jgi:hypothetical protein
LIIHKKSSKKENKILWNNIKQIEEDNKKLENNIYSLCNQVILDYKKTKIYTINSDKTN